MTGYYRGICTQYTYFKKVCTYNICIIFKGFSAVFECCGSNGPMDFVNATVAIDCCEENPRTGRTYQDGCGKKAAKEFSTALNCLLIPSVFILLLELIVLTMVPFLIGRVQYYQYLPQFSSSDLFTFFQKLIYFYIRVNNKEWTLNSNQIRLNAKSTFGDILKGLCIFFLYKNSKNTSNPLCYVSKKKNI